MQWETVERGIRRKIVGDLLRKRRLTAGLSQLDVARCLGYTTGQLVSNWERGLALPAPRQLFRLAGALNIPIREVVDACYRVDRRLIHLRKRQLAEQFARYQLDLDRARY